MNSLPGKAQPLLDFGRPFYDKLGTSSYEYGSYEENATENCRFNLLCLEYGEYYLGDYAAVQHKVIDLDADNKALTHPTEDIDLDPSSTTDSSNMNTKNSVDYSSNSANEYSLSHIPLPKVRKTTRVILEGRLRVASRSLVFEPDDKVYPVVRYPYRFFKGDLMSFSNTSLPSAINSSVGTDGSFAFHTSLFLEMKENDIVGPFITKKETLPNQNHCTGVKHKDGIIYGDVEMEHEFLFGLMHTSLEEFLPLLQKLLEISQKSFEVAAGKRYEEEELQKLTIRKRLNKAKIFEMSHLVDFNEKILLNIPVEAERITPLLRAPGCIMITNERLYFKPADVNNVGGQVLKYDLNRISWIFRRRFLLRQRGLEIFIASDNVVDGSTRESDNDISKKAQLKKSYSSSSSYKNSSVKESIYLQFNSEAERNRIYNLLLQQASNVEKSCLHRNIDLSSMTIMWQKRQISNYDYLSYLNSYADRSINDLTQYPVFPWVIADYTSKKLKLDDPATFRDLSKPIGALNEERLTYLRERYLGMPPEDKEMGIPPPFLYGTHYSTPAYVLFYLVRSAPEYMLCLQSGRFDAPDRLFINIHDTWNSVLNNASDLKELIPEFYSPSNNGEFLLNKDDLPLGTTQTGHKVDNVQLPPWAKSPQDFVKKCRKALESDYVSNHLHEWIDLIFGYKQRGIAAVESDNVFFHLTYEGAVDMEKITDPLEKEALEVQIGEFGQCPRQLFLFPHPNRNDAPLERTSHVSINPRLRETDSSEDLKFKGGDRNNTDMLQLNDKNELLPSLKDANLPLNEALLASRNSKTIDSNVNHDQIEGRIPSKEHKGTVRIGSQIAFQEQQQGNINESVSGGFLTRLGQRSSEILGNFSSRFRGNSNPDQEMQNQSKEEIRRTDYQGLAMNTTLEAIGEKGEDYLSSSTDKKQYEGMQRKDGVLSISPHGDINNNRTENINHDLSEALQRNNLDGNSVNKMKSGSILNPNSPDRRQIKTSTGVDPSTLSPSPSSNITLENVNRSGNGSVSYGRYVSEDAVDEVPENAKYGLVMISSEPERIHAEIVTSLQFIRNGKEFLSTSHDGSFRQHNLTSDVGGIGAMDENGEPLPLVSIRTKKRFQWIPTTGAPLSSFTLIHQNQLAVVASWDYYMYIYSLQTGEQLGAIHGHNEAISVVEYPKRSLQSIPNHSPLPSSSISPSSPSTPSTKNNSSLFQKMSSMVGFGTSESGFDPSICYPYLFTGSWDGSVKMWELTPSGLHSDALSQFKGYDKPISALSFNPDESLIAAGTEDGEILVYDIRSGTVASQIGKSQNSGWGGVINLGWTKQNELLIGNIAGKLSLLTLDGNEMSSVIHTPPVPQRVRSLSLYSNIGNKGTPKSGIRGDLLSPTSPSLHGDSQLSPRIENRITCMSMKPGGDCVVGGDALGVIKIWKNEYGTLKEWGCSEKSRKVVPSETRSNLLSPLRSSNSLSSPLRSSNGNGSDADSLSEDMNISPITAIEVEWGTGRMIVGDADGRVRVIYMYQDS